MTEELIGKTGLRKTVGRCATEGNNSGRFYSPVEINLTDGQRQILLRTQDRQNEIALWPEEAKELGLGLIEFGTLAAEQSS